MPLCRVRPDARQLSTILWITPVVHRHLCIVCCRKQTYYRRKGTLSGRGGAVGPTRHPAIVRSAFVPPARFRELSYDRVNPDAASSTMVLHGGADVAPHHGPMLRRTMARMAPLCCAATSAPSVAGWQAPTRAGWEDPAPGSPSVAPGSPSVAGWPTG